MEQIHIDSRTLPLFMDLAKTPYTLQARSALSSILTPRNLFRFMRRVYTSRPILPRYRDLGCPYRISQVKAMSPSSPLSLNDLLKNLSCMQIAVVSVRQERAIHLLKFIT